MNYQVIQPPENLLRFVRFFWTIEAYDATSRQNILKIFARRFPRLVFQHNHGHSAIQRQSKDLPIAFLSGINAKPYTCTIDTTFSLTGVSFYPVTVKALFGIDAFELTEQLPELQNFAPISLTDNLLNAKEHSEKIAILIKFLSDRSSKNAAKDFVVGQSIQWINNNTNEISIDYLLKQFKISERQLERRFRINMGPG